MYKEQKSDKKILILSPYRTGSTVVFQIVKLLTGETPEKTHDIQKDFYKGILCLRDPYYSIGSMFRLKTGRFEDLLSHNTEWYRFWESNKNDSRLLTIRYEDYINDPILKIKKISEFLKININDKEINLINEKTSIENNKKIASRFSNFSEYDKNTNIHGDHVRDPFNTNIINYTINQEEQINILRIKMGYKIK